MTKQRVIVNGAQGKMGRLASETLRNHPDFELVAELGRQDNLAQCIVDTRALIVVDLTRADCVYRNTQIIIEQGAHPVIGATGLTPDQIRALTATCEQHGLGGLIAPNFSLAAILMMQFSAIAGRYLHDVEIIEAHHPQKIDAPSGTAVKTADLIAKSRDTTKQTSSLSTEQLPARGELHHGIPIHALRLPGVLAQQDVIFGQHGETLTLTHRTIDRASFMPGLVLACQRVTSLTTLCYGLEHVLAIFSND